MAHSTLADRQKEYEDPYDFIITRKLPIIIRVDGRSFSRITKKFKKPYDYNLTKALTFAMQQTVKEIDGCVFAYQQSDEITFIAVNDNNQDTTPWFANRIQKIVSVTSSLVTLHFNRFIDIKDENPVFDARVFAVPSLMEAVHNLVWRQNDAYKNAVTSAAQHQLNKAFGKSKAQKMLYGKSTEDRIQLLEDEFEIVFEDEYPLFFQRGIAAYKAPFLVENENNEEELKTRWIVNEKLPVFKDRKDFLYSILSHGSDIYRPETI